MDTHEEHSIIEHLLTFLNELQSGEEFQTSNAHTSFQIKKFIDELPGGFLIYRAVGDEQIIYANRALQRIFKCNSFAEFTELTGGTFKGLVYHEDLEEVEKSIAEQILNSQEDLDYVEYRIMGKDGVMRWVEDYGHFVHTDSAGDIFYVFISEATEKITRRNAERAKLNEKEETEQKLLNKIEEYDKERKLIRQEHLQRLEVIEGLSVNYESILYVDIDADKILPYRLSSRLSKQFDNKLQTRPFRWFIDDYVNYWVHPDDRNYVAERLSVEYIKKHLSETPTYYINFRAKQNGDTKYLQLRLVDVGNSGCVNQFVMGYRSIDDEVLQEMQQKKLLEEALNNAKLASEAKNTFLSNMSHDMRTPLNAIFGYTALAKKNLCDGKAVAEYLGKIETSGRQILELIERVLEISSMDSNDFHVTDSKCNLLNLVQNVYNSILPRAEAKDLNISIHATQVKQGNVYADEEKLKQVLLHIVNNAVKYSRNGGNVNITIAEQPSKIKDYASFRFIIKDNGIGIDRKFLNRIFEPFEREHNTTASGIFGTGLGLTIAKHITEMMGGTIEVESEPDRGSVFTVAISFRLQHNKEKNSTEKENTLATLQGGKILLVDDNEINLEIESELLEDLGFEVEIAENGQIAVDKIKNAKPNEYLFVLMDIQMPVMDGRQATREIRKLKNKELANIPVIALSANAFERDKKISMEAGLDEHLNKPIDIPLLIKTVSDILSKRKN